LRFVERTHAGIRREKNEDKVRCGPESGLFMVADGMGGHSFGAEAARTAVETLENRLGAVIRGAVVPLDFSAREDILRKAFEEAHERIVDFARRNARGHTVGTTATALWLGSDGRAAVAHVGDSRLYLMRDNALRQMTKDHTFVQEAVDIGRITPDQARKSPYAHTLTRALGIADRHECDVFELALQPGDMVLICSDGLSGVAVDSEIESMLADSGDRDLDALADTLVELALDRGGPDNISLVLLDFE